MFTYYVNFSKEFDSVNYWKLFAALLKDGVSPSIVSLLAFWYRPSKVSVSWHSVASKKFGMKNGTRQESLLSPYLLVRYICGFIYAVCNSHIGCNIGGVFYTILAHA